MSSSVPHSASEREPLIPVPSSFPPSEEPRRGSVQSHPESAEEAEDSIWRSDGLVLKLGASMFDFFTTGCAMAAVGALIPDIERHYSTNNGTTAFIFPAGVLGYVCATASVESICLRFGHRAIAVLCPLVRFLAALLLSAEPAFGVTLIAYAGLGFGSGLTDTAWNAWASGMRRPNVLQGLLHGSFSLGCILGPIVVVALLRQYEWSSFYLVIALLSLVELLTQGYAFRHDTAAIYTQHHHHPPPALPSANDDTTSDKSIYLLRQPIIYISGAFYFLYMAVEATFTGWIVVFMLRARHAPSTTAGLTSSTFWLGMTVGRYALGLVTERFGVGKAVSAYIVLALVLQVLLNLVTNLSATMALLAANGAFIAPLFPSGIVLLVSRLQAHMHMRAVALLIALGQVGGALTQLAVGFMADSLGIRHLFEVVCGISMLMLVAWIFFARVE